jgi:branched-chain amino acid aminotransferase
MPLTELAFMERWISYNGKLLPADTPLVGAESRAIRYGDGLFETIRMRKGEMPLFSFHMERFFSGLIQLGFEKGVHLTPASLQEDIVRLAQKNKVLNNARIRLNAIRGNGGVYDPENNKPNIIIEAVPLGAQYDQLNENGLVIGVYPDARKSMDRFSNLKSNNFLPYTLGAFYAKANHWNDALILNQFGRICETTLANIFWMEGDVIYTPPLSEGAVAGVMRRYLIERQFQMDKPIVEKNLSIKDLEKATAVFITNAISGIKWVKQFDESHYEPAKIITLYNDIVKTIYSL